MSEMVIVSGHVIVDPGTRDDYVRDCIRVVEAGRVATGCLDFAISADPVDPARVNILERWRSVQDVEAFRGSGPDDGQQDQIRSADVRQYGVTGEQRLS